MLSPCLKNFFNVLLVDTNIFLLYYSLILDHRRLSARSHAALPPKYLRVSPRKRLWPRRQVLGRMNYLHRPSSKRGSLSRRFRPRRLTVAHPVPLLLLMVLLVLLVLLSGQ